MGNICRSPMAEEIFRQITIREGVQDKYEVDSAGTYGGHEGELADPRMRRAAEERGYNLTHRSRPLLEQDFGRFDMVVVMDDRNLDDSLRMTRSLDDYAKLSRMADYAVKGSYDHIPDPYHGGSQGFYSVIDMLEDSCEGLFRKLESDSE